MAGSDSGEGGTPVYTIGYGSRSMDEFIAVLQAYQINYLIDIRSTPYSRYKPDFSKGALEAHLRAYDIRYVYMGENLGGQPADRSCYVDDKVLYELVREKEFYQEGIRRVQAAFQRQLRVALMCSEGKPEACHRSKLIGQTLADLSVAVLHIDEHGAPRTQAEIVSELTDGQLSLFGDHDLHIAQALPANG